MARTKTNMQFMFKVDDLPMRWYDDEPHRVIMIDRDIDLALILDERYNTTQWVSMRNLEDR